MDRTQITRYLTPLIFGLLLGPFAWAPAAAQDTLQHGKDQRADHYEHDFESPERYAESWNDPERDGWQNPDAVIEAMGIEEGMTVVDLGTGTGYFLPHLSQAVGEKGQVLAVDIEPAMLEYVAEVAKKQTLPNIDTVLARPENTQLEKSSVDRILTVNTWHHIPDRGAYAKHLAGRLKKEGAVWVIDFTEAAPMGPPKRHRLDPQVVADELEEGGFDTEIPDLGLPHQYVVVGRPE